MLTARARANYAHLLGSVPLADTETVLVAPSALSWGRTFCDRIPDGETGERLYAHSVVGFQPLPLAEGFYFP